MDTPRVPLCQAMTGCACISCCLYCAVPSPRSLPTRVGLRGDAAQAVRICRWLRRLERRRQPPGLSAHRLAAQGLPGERLRRQPFQWMCCRHRRRLQSRLSRHQRRWEARPRRRRRSLRARPRHRCGAACLPYCAHQPAYCVRLRALRRGGCTCDAAGVLGSMHGRCPCWHAST